MEIFSLSQKRTNACSVRPSFFNRTNHQNTGLSG